MGINLQKGQKINLTKDGQSTLSKIMVGLGWDEAQQSNGGIFGGIFGRKKVQPIDCDASVILCGKDGRIVSNDLQECCVYFGNLKHPSGAIIHQGDNLTGEGEGDDEQIMVNLKQVPSYVEKMVFVVNIYDGHSRNQHFGMIENAFIRLVDLDKNTEICKFNLSENYDNMTGLVVGEIYRRNGEWKFNAIGQPIQEASRLDSLLKLYI